MALIKCHECGTEVSTEAKTCPKCGAKPKKPAGLTAWLIGILIVVGFVSASITGQEQAATAAAAEAAKTPEQREAEKAQKEADIKRFAAARGVSQVLRESMRDPESLIFESLRVNDDASVVCAEYRSRNGFGGMSREFIVVTKDGTSQKQSAWNKRCVQTMSNMMRAAK